jgi:hypothetical protein
MADGTEREWAELELAGAHAQALLRGRAQGSGARLRFAWCVSQCRARRHTRAHAAAGKASWLSERSSGKEIVCTLRTLCPCDWGPKPKHLSAIPCDGGRAAPHSNAHRMLLRFAGRRSPTPRCYRTSTYACTSTSCKGTDASPRSATASPRTSSTLLPAQPTPASRFWLATTSTAGCCRTCRSVTATGATDRVLWCPTREQCCYTNTANR